MVRHSFLHVVWSWRASPNTEAFSARNWPIAHQHARRVDNARLPAM